MIEEKLFGVIMEEINIGAKVQEFRKARGISLRELAANTSLSASMLSQVENSSVNPSINTLKSIAEALQVPLFKFFKDDPLPDKLIVRKGQYKIIGKEGKEVLYKLLTPDVSGMIEFCLMEIPAGVASADVPREHSGEEVAFVISGETDIYLSGEIYHLNEGDGMKIPPFSPHRWINCSKKTVKVIFAVTPPTF